MNSTYIVLAGFPKGGSLIFKVYANNIVDAHNKSVAFLHQHNFDECDLIDFVINKVQ